jgi:predicted AAA+ superfamily ATPase
MRVVQRELTKLLTRATREFPAIVLSGPRRVGKTFLLRRAFPRASYYLLEDPDILARVKSDPRGWLDDIETPAILDEIQNAPELFAYVRTLIDRQPSKRGQWFLTGSQDFALMAGVSESMAGRAAILQLTGLSYREVGSWNLRRGGFPEAVLQRRSLDLWFGSYLQSYLERDVRSLRAVKDLATFRRFLALLATRHGQILNRSDLAAPLGVSVPTISEWVGVLETTGQIVLVPPFYDNLGKRLVKSPKVYFMDSGLVCFLLGFRTDRQLSDSPFVGPVFEGFVAAEIVKNQVNRGLLRELYFFRDERGLEVDFVVPAPGGKLQLVEAKWSKTIRPAMAVPLQKLRAAFGPRQVNALIVHPAPKTDPGTKTVLPGVRSATAEEFLALFPTR